MRRPFRLEDRFTGSARNASRMRDLAIGREIADPGLCRRPRHIGVIPAQPGESISRWVQPRRRIEIGARNENAGLPLAREVDADKRVDRLCMGGMRFADANQAAAAPVDDAIGVAQAIRVACSRRESDWPRLAAAFLAIESLIRIVREIDDAVANRERPAAVLMDASADAKAVLVVRRDRFDFPAFRHAIDEAPSLLLRLTFAPVEDVSVQRDLLEPDRIGDDEIGGDGRPPKTIRARDHRSCPNPGGRPSTAQRLSMPQVVL